MAHIELLIETGAENADILIAQLSDIGFEGFEQADDWIKAYISEELYQEDLPATIFTRFNEGIKWQVRKLEDRNWNAEWEKNFEAVIIGNKCHVRAPFHAVDPSCETEIIIEPKMSFGTAHHETTAMMMEFIMETDISGNRVLDMGCGTGILAILALKLGAASALAIDNDDWAVNNAIENIAYNKTGNCKVLKGDATSLQGETFDLILANINRNILLEDLPYYAESLNPGGDIFLSGFLEKDRNLILEAAVKLKLTEQRYKSKNGWIALMLG